MATTNTSGLVKNTDFSAELLLNKVMNKQYKAQNGNTLTLAGKLNASKLDSDAQAFGVQAENLAKDTTFADSVQNVMSELLSLTKDIQSNANNTDSDALSTLGTAFTQAIDALKLATAPGETTAILGGAQKTVNLGLGDGTILLGQSDISTIVDNINTLAGSMASGSSVNPTEFDAYISQLNGAIAAEGAKASLLHNRYDALNDLVSSYQDASNDQVVTNGGSASSLLNSLL